MFTEMHVLAYESLNFVIKELFLSEAGKHSCVCVCVCLYMCVCIQ